MNQPKPTTQQQATPAEDVEAHAIRNGRRNEDSPPPEAVEREQPFPDTDDDVEGHAAHGRF